MELVQEVYFGLKVNETEWPDKAVIAIKDSDGKIKFSSVGKYDVTLDEVSGIYMRGEHCLFNNMLVEDIRIGFGKSEHPDIVTRSEYEDFYHTREDN